MKYSKIYKVMFSPTFSTKEVLDKMCEDYYPTWDIDLTDPNFKGINITDGFVIFGVPCYGGRVPEVATERLKLVTGNVPCAIVMTYGNREFDDGLVELEDIVSNNGFKVYGAASAITNHSVFKSVGKGRPDEEDYSKLEDFMDQVLAKEELTKLNIRGHRPYIKEVRKIYFKIDFDEDKCISCGACENMCPVGAINDLHETDLDKCISCLRCIKVCTEKARTLSEEVLAKEESFKERCKERKEVEYFI